MKRTHLHFRAAALLVTACAVVPAAQATVKLCNHSGMSVDVAFAYGAKDPAGVSTGGHGGVTAEGWWGLAPNECATVGTMDAKQYWLYYHAKREGARTSSSSMLCVASRPFALRQQFRREGDNCPDGQRLRGFKRFDADKTNWTLNLS